MAVISAKAIKELKLGHRYDLLHNLDEDMAVHVHLTPLDGSIRIRAYLVTLNPRGKVLGVAPITRTVKNINTLDVDVRDCCLSLHTRFCAKQTIKTTKSYSPKAFAQRVLSLPDIFNPENYNKYTKKGWGLETTKQYVTYYAHTIGKAYQRFGLDASRDELLLFRDELVDKIYKAGYKHPCKDGLTIKRRREPIYNDVNQRFSYARIVQKYLLETYPEMGWPSVEIPVTPRVKTGKAENIKAITMEQYIKSVALVKRLCYMGCPYAFASLLEVLGGARIGESCAPLVGEFEIDGDCCRYYIEHQIGKDRKRTRTLKNEQSHRYTYLGPLMVEMIGVRKAQLEAAGYTPEEYKIMPFASSLNAVEEHLDKGRVSGFLRRILTLAGCDEDWLEREAERLYVAAEASGNSDDVGVGAHEFRSTLATYWSNGGLSVLKVDAMLGHENPLNKDEDYASWQAGKQIVAETERAIYLGSLSVTRNPAIRPIVVDKSINFKLLGNKAYRFYCQEDLYVEIDVQTLEGDDEIVITGSDALKSTAMVRREIPDSDSEESERPILPNLPSEDDVERWIGEAYTIDLEKIIERYGV